MKRLLLAPVMLLLTSSHAFGWGNEGHQAIAEAAQGALSDRANSALGTILFGADQLPPGALASVATWPDEVRARGAFGTVAPGWDDAAKHEADKFNSDHKTNASWHFVNLPLGATGYQDPASLSPGDPMRAFVGPDDIVQAMKRCITVLESQTAPGDFSKAQAVRWLVHLVGDIHQPCT
jgi:S1/P1 Nuclease